MVRMRSVLSMRCMLSLMTVAVGLFVQPHAAVAQVYTCTDAQGKFIISDRLLKECANRPVTELDRRGMPVREIAAPMSEAARRQQENADKQRNRAQAKDEERERQGQALMARYKSEQEIELARQKEVAHIDQRIADSEAAIQQAEQQLASAQRDASQVSQADSARDAAQKRIRDARQLIVEQKKLGSASRRDKDQLNARYTQTLQTFRELRDQRDSQSPAPDPAKSGP